MHQGQIGRIDTVTPLNLYHETVCCSIGFAVDSGCYLMLILIVEALYLQDRDSQFQARSSGELTTFLTRLAPGGGSSVSPGCLTGGADCADGSTADPTGFAAAAKGLSADADAFTAGMASLTGACKDADCKAGVKDIK